MALKKHDSLNNSTISLSRFPIRKSELDRFKYGKKNYFEAIVNCSSNLPNCLDVASGAKPFPKASLLCDLNFRPVPDRRMKNLERAGKPFVLCDSRFLPFKDNAFDFVTSYYLIEHMSDPWSLFKELRRVSKHGYIQCPSWFNELLYGEEVHQWIVYKCKSGLFIKPIKNGNKIIRFGFIFHRLYKLTSWQIMHAILDETFHIFTVSYNF
jgi:SAM-dependent methyltransferase